MTELFSTHHMKVEVVHNLAGVLAGVRTGPIPGFGDSGGLGNLLHSREKVAQECGMLSVQIIHRNDMLLGNHEDMNWGQGLYVVECDDVFVLVDFGRRDLTCHDFAEDAVCGHGESLQANKVSRGHLLIFINPCQIILPYPMEFLHWRRPQVHLWRDFSAKL
jgi:hypothetical protein